MANKLKALDELSKAIPDLNQAAAKRAQAASQIQLQQQLGAAPQQANVTRTAQSVAPQLTQQQGQIQQQAAQQTTQQMANVGQQMVQQQGFQDQQTLAAADSAQRADLAGQEQRQGLNLQREQVDAKKTLTQRDIQSQKTLQRLGIDMDRSLQMATQKQREDLSSLGNDLEGKLLDSRMAFERDEMGRKFTNERQLADWTAANAETENEFRSNMQAMEQESQKKLKLMEISMQGLQDALQRGYIEKKGDLDFAHQKKLLDIQKALQKKIQKEQAAAKNRAAMFNAGGMILGAAVVAASGGAAAPIMMGAAMGGAGGTILGGATS